MINVIVQGKDVINIEKRTVLNVFFTYYEIYATLSELTKKYEITLEQFNVLRILRGQKKQPINMGEIQERMVARSSNSTRIVDKLVEKKLVDRRICPNNKRKMEIVITNQGLEKLSKIDPEIEEMEKQLSKNLSLGELLHLNELLTKYRTIKNDCI
ncbi:MAG: MarR family transcriptional regulator [Flavobacteriales bacterium]|nr:MarR family transcriptional regulator [Flavobacteriales bacterium]